MKLPPEEHRVDPGKQTGTKRIGRSEVTKVINLDEAPDEARRGALKTQGHAEACASGRSGYCRTRAKHGKAPIIPLG
jgi:hypothetical protein